MENLPPEPAFSPPAPSKGMSSGTKVAIGCFAALLVLLCVLILVGAYIFIERDQFTGITEMFATPVPTRMVPDIIGPQPTAGIEVFHEDFSTNQRSWISYYSDMETSVRNGTIFIESYNKGYVGLAVCDTCDSYTGTYYIQADLALDQSSTVLFGLAFSITDRGYYIVEVNAKNRLFSVYKLVNGAWDVLIENQYAASIENHPQTNTLGVYFDQGRIEVYINDELAGTTEDPNPYTGGLFGLYVDDATVVLQADEVYAYQVP